MDEKTDVSKAGNNTLAQGKFVQEKSRTGKTRTVRNTYGEKIVKRNKILV